MKKIINKIAFYFFGNEKSKKEQNTIVCFFPKHSRCAVEKTYKLIHFGDTPQTQLRYDVLYMDKKNIDKRGIEKLEKYDNIVIFGHYHPDYPNLLIQNGKFLNTSLSPHFKDKLTYGHVCFGAFFFKENSNFHWISYTDYLQLFFGNPDTDDRIVIFFEKIFNTIGKNENRLDLFEKIRNLYIEELKFLKRNEKSNVGYLGHYSFLYNKFKLLKANNAWFTYLIPF